MSFPQDVRTKVLLWCDRHCCLCKKICGVNIEIHHLIPVNEGGSDNIENAMPLCFDCHSEVERYNTKHPKGNKYSVEELKARRDQVYEDFTRHLVPPVVAQITQRLPGGEERKFPDVGFVLTHAGDSLPVQVLVTIESMIDGSAIPIVSDQYGGIKTWKLNPQTKFSGHFFLQKDLIPENRSIELRVRLQIIDQFGRFHDYLPVGFVYVQDGNYWYAEP